MTDKYIQIIDNSPDPLTALAKNLEEQANNIKEKDLKALEQNISALSGFLAQLGGETDS